MHESVLEFHHVGKSFAGTSAVRDLSFSVGRGEVFALLGPNGAGKTTAVRMLVGMIEPDQGHIEVRLGETPSSRLPPHLFGYLPEERGLYRDISILRTVVYFGMLRGLGRREAQRSALAWLERFGLLDRKDERVDALSKGNQQRVQLIAAVVHAPALAILDEPFTGLDPLSQELFVELVGELQRAGTTILLSAHQMDLVERVADRVLLLNHGREILSGSIHELHQRLDSRPRIRLTLEPGADAHGLSADPLVEALEHDGETLHVVLREGASTAEFLTRAMSQVPVRGLTEAPRLHDIFLRAVREDDQTQGRTS